MSIFDNKKRSANAISLTNSKLLTISKEDFDNLLDNEKDIAIKCYKNIFLELCNRIRNTNQTIQDRIIWGFNIS